MRRVIRAAVAALLVGGAAQAQVQILPAPVQPGGGIGIGRPGKPMADQPGPPALQKAMNSQLVVSGTVSLGKDTTDLLMYQGAQAKTTYKVATIKVADTLLGDKVDSVKVLVAPSDPAQIPFERPGGQPQPDQYFPQYYLNSIQVIDGQEGVFFLQKHPTAADQWVLAPSFAPLNPLDTKYKDDLAAVKQVGAVYADPVKALKAKEADDKLRAAVVLMTKYGRWPQGFQGPGQPERKAIPAEESKLILKALADADWEKWDKQQQQPDPNMDWTMNPANVLGMMQVYPGQKGFPQFQAQPGQYYSAYKAAFKDWLDGNGKDFEIQRYVQPGEKKDGGKKDEPKKDEPKKDPAAPDVIKRK